MSVAPEVAPAAVPDLAPGQPVPPSNQPYEEMHPFELLDRMEDAQSHQDLTTEMNIRGELFNRYSEAYADTSLTDTARAWARTENIGGADSGIMEDVLRSKFNEAEEAHQVARDNSRVELAEGDHNPSGRGDSAEDFAHASEFDQQGRENRWNRLMTVRERELARLQNQGQPETSPKAEAGKGEKQTTAKAAEAPENTQASAADTANAPVARKRPADKAAPERPAIKAAPERLAIEAPKEQLAIEGPKAKDKEMDPGEAMLHEILTDEAAQQAFAVGGEEGYQKHIAGRIEAEVQKHLDAIEKGLAGMRGKGDELDQLDRDIAAARERVAGEKTPHQVAQEKAFDIVYRLLNSPDKGEFEAGQRLLRQMGQNQEVSDAFKDYATARRDAEQAKKDGEKPEGATDDEYAQAQLENAAYDKEFKKLEKYADRYAQQSAEQSGQHLGRLEEGGRFKKLWRKLPFSHGKRSEKRDELTEKARQNYLTAMNKFVQSDAYLATHGNNENGRGRSLEQQIVITKLVGEDGVETTIEKYMPMYADDANSGLRGKVGKFVYKIWPKDASKGRKLVRGAIVAGPALVFGAGVGVGAAAIAGPALLTVGLGVAAAYGGRKIGHGISRAVNRRGVAEELTNGQHKYYGRNVTSNENEDARYARRQEYIRDVVDSGRGKNTSMREAMTLEQTDNVEAGTTAAVRENMQRRKVAGRVGAMAASAGFIAGEALVAPSLGIGGHGPEATNTGSGQAGAGSNGGPAAPPNLPPSHVTPPAAHTGAENINPNQAPWTVAHQMHPGAEFHTMTETMRDLNHTMGMHLHYVHQPNGTIWIENGNHALNALQQHAFNTFMEHFATS